MIPDQTEAKLIHYPLLSQFSEISVFTTTRIREASSTLLSEESIRTVLENGNEEKFWYNITGTPENCIAKANQIHGNTVLFANDGGHQGDGDALISNIPQIFLRIVTADCLPVFMYDPESKTVALVHAGWRGLKKEIINRTIEYLGTKAGVNPENLFVSIGPFIQECCYTVRDDVYSEFPRQFSTKLLNGYYNLRLGEIALAQLSGVPSSQVEITSQCTSCSDDTFYSARKEKGNTGRNINIIGILK